jgi:hypothetical protein
MKRLRHESRSRKQERKTSNPIRAAAVGFSVALAFLPSCEPNMSKSEAVQQVRNQDPEKRVEAVEALEGDETQLKKLAMCARYDNVRLAAVETLPDSASFGDIAIESDYVDSALAALERIGGDNEYLLSLVAERSKHSPVRIAALERIGKDEEKLTSIISDSKYEDVKIAAADVLASMMDELKGLTALVEIAKYSTKEKARVAAVSKLKIETQYSLLQTVAVDSLHENTRAIALTMLKTSVLPITHISDVVRKLGIKELERKDLGAGYQRTKATASDILAYMVDELTGAESLKYVFRYSHNDGARAVAFMKLEGMVNEIKDAEALMDLATYSQNAETRVAAIKRIWMNDILKDFVLNSKYPDVRLAAVGKLAEDLPALKEIALGNGEYEDDARMTAIQLLSRNLGMLKEARLNEPETSSTLHLLERSKYYLYGIAKGLIGNDGNKEMLLTALDGLAPVVPELKKVDLFYYVLAEIALQSRIAEGRLAAIDTIEWSDKLKDIAEKAEYEDARLAAIEKLAESKYLGSYMLEKVAANSKYKETRLAAFRKIANDYEGIEIVALTSPYMDTAMMALRRLRGRAKPLSVVVINTEGKLRDTALEMLTPLVYETNYSGALECIAMYSPDADARKEAVERAKKNRRLLRYLSGNSKFKDTREMAREMLSR